MVFQFVYSNVYPEIYSFAEKRGIDLRNNFHLKLKKWKDKKKYSQKSIDGYFWNSEWSPLFPGAVQKKLVTVEGLEREKMADEQKQKEIGEKKPKKKNWGEKLQQKIRNWRKLKKRKKKTRTKKNCRRGSKS